MKKRVVVFGNQQIAIDCMQWMQKRKDIQIVAFVGCEKPQDKIYGYPSTRKFCEKNNIYFVQPTHLDEALYKDLKNWKPDICISIYYRKIFSKKYLKVPSLGFLNIHPSLLPKYRGAMPTLWALLNNEKIVGITLHYLDKGIDTGDIIGQKLYIVSKNITGYQLHVHLMHLGFRLFKQMFPMVIKGTAPRLKQDHTQATYYSVFDQKIRSIDWYSSTEKILARICALAKPYSGAIIHILDKDVIIWGAKRITLSKKNLGESGKIVKLYKDGTFVISCVDGFLRIMDYMVPKKSKNCVIRVGNKCI